MKTMRTGIIAAFVLTATAMAAQAGTVTVKGVHLCCGACIRDVAKALKGADGVSEAKCDKDAKTVTYEAKDDDAAKAGIKALAKAGFHGTAAHGDKKLAFPKSGAKKDSKADTVTINGVHLCCGACVKAVAAALKDIKAEAKCDRDAKTVTLTGKDIDITAAVAALNKAGFHGRIKKAKKK